MTAHARLPAGDGLAYLAAQAAREMDLLGYPVDPWLPPAQGDDGQPMDDVVVVGGGQAGMAIAFALRRERVDRVRVIDAAPAGREGPWDTFARMNALRTPKYLTGLDYGIPSLTFRAWYEAQGLSPAWPDLARIPRPQWIDYLAWFRRVAGIEVANDTRLVSIAAHGDVGLRLTLADPSGERRVLTRRVVLATGMDGSGAWTVPPGLVDDLPREAWAHSADPLPLDRLAGRRVAVLGAGASAFDNAAAALDSGAASVDLYFRRPKLEILEFRAWLENNGFLRHYFDLPDRAKWRVMRYFCGGGTPPPPWSVDLVNDDPRFTINPGCAWVGTRWREGRVAIDTAKGEREADFLILATGMALDLPARPELAAFAGHIALWGDRYTPPDGAQCPPLARYPYLARDFSFTEKAPGMAPYLSRIHVFNWGATPSCGVTAASITGLKFGLGRLIWGLTSALYAEVADDHVDSAPFLAR